MLLYGCTSQGTLYINVKSILLVYTGIGTYMGRSFNAQVPRVSLAWSIYLEERINLHVQACFWLGFEVHKRPVPMGLE
jgi:hypothetical protein